MTRPFDDDPLGRELRGVLRARAEEIASQARTVEQLTTELTPRLIAIRRPRPGGVTLRVAAVVVAVLLLLLGAVLIGPGLVRQPLDLLLAVQMPLAGEPIAPQIVDAVQLALRDRAIRDDLRIDLELKVFDDSVDGASSPERAADNLRNIAADPRFVAVIGPFHSFVAEATIPIANAAGLLQCSPTNTAPWLTRGEEAAALRPNPSRPSYVRLAAADDVAAIAAARVLKGMLAKDTVFVVTTVEPFAGGRAASIVDAYELLGGSVVGRGSIGEGGDPPQVLAAQVEASGAAAVFFDGLSADGGPVLAALAAAGVDVPFVGLDIILDGPRSKPGSFLSSAGDGGGAYAILPAGRDAVLGPQFAEAFQNSTGYQPGDLVPTGHACATVILDALNRLDPSRLAGPADWREALRAEVTAIGPEYETAIGTIRFDAFGDAQPQRLSVYRTEAGGDDWEFWQLVELGSD